MAPAAAKGRAKQMHALAAELQAEWGVVTETSYDGRAWMVSWSNGPVTMRGTVATRAPRLGLDPDAIRLCRLVQDDAMPVQAVRLGRAGQLPLSGRPAAVARAIELAGEQTDYPERPADDTEAALAGRLAAETAAQPDTRWVDANSIAELICRQGGIGWLLAPLDSTPDGAGMALNSLDAALAVLTAAYASGQVRQNWVERGTLMDASSALAAVRADPAPVSKTACAGLTVLREEMKKLERAELDLLDAARCAGGTWAQISIALAAGTRQAAYKRHRDLTSRHQHLRARVDH
jgi:hypothetical protein